MIALANDLQILSDIEVDPEVKTINSCGSGITACILDLTLRLFGSRSTSVYDGSWAEYNTIEEPDYIKAIQI